MKQTLRTAGCERDDIVVYFWYRGVNCEVVMAVILGDSLLGWFRWCCGKRARGGGQQNKRAAKGKVKWASRGRSSQLPHNRALRISIPRGKAKSRSAASWDSFFPNVRPNSISELLRDRPHLPPVSAWTVLRGTNSRPINFPNHDCVFQGSTMLGGRSRSSQWTEANAYTISSYASRKHENTSSSSEGMPVQARWP